MEKPKIYLNYNEKGDEELDELPEADKKGIWRITKKYKSVKLVQNSGTK